MTASVRTLFNTTVAASSVAVVALGLLAAPPDTGTHTFHRVELGFIHLSTAVTMDSTALVNTTPLDVATPLPGIPVTPEAKTTQASSVAADTASDAFIQNLATVIIGTAALPFWYVGFPVTLPVSIMLGIGAANVFNSLPIFFGGGGQWNPISIGVIGAVLGLSIFVAGIPSAIYSSLSRLMVPVSPAAAAKSAVSATAALAASATGRTTHRAFRVQESPKLTRTHSRPAAPRSVRTGITEEPASSIQPTADSASATAWAPTPDTKKALRAPSGKALANRSRSRA